MANWISSKLKAAESILQQIDQQAAESLGKTESPLSPSDRPRSNANEIRRKSDVSVPLKHQLPSRTSPREIKRPPSPPPPPDGHQWTGDDPGPGVADGDWTELLSSPSPAVPRPSKKLGGAPKPKRLQSGGRLQGNSGPRSTSGASSDQKPRTSAQEPRGGDPGDVDVGKPLLDLVGVAAADRAGGLHSEEPVADGDGRRTALESSVEYRDPTKSSLGSNEESDTETDSVSSSDSEEERQRREERRKRRERILAEKAAAAAAEAIREREDLVTRLEGEKQGLVKILEEREKQQAQEALELQVSMIETMEAVEQEKQKHNSTRMEALACLAMLETSNLELANLLATAQWNLEVEVNRVVELHQQLESKELILKEHKLKISKIHQSSSVREIESSKRSELQMEILDAEYSFLCDKISKLKDKAKKLEENIVVTRREIVHPSEVEMELKKRLAQLTDRLIQKQGQVEALSSEKATILFRIETVSRLLDENGSSVQASDFTNFSDMGFVGSSVRADIEAGISIPSKSASMAPFSNRIGFRRQQLGSILQQLDAIFSAGALIIKRSQTAQLWSLIYLLCLHLWVIYILMSHTR